ncbi:BZ3500_MvSof-1268-A1-R1_Chr9g10691 [Microbotryum saponariae]|uniref:BZ3500_MvSof-1268-A1-R1_Chr9g10691 protein n=1 Tax=Microbotryum saponariae TaxID=289078 RepID=A0A2X0L1U7_9BASI|nr:BZ3501_MvSof-1269-A2-R1_Chr9g10439 [Microbotryum saponariae]SDA00531.1 BZ3500_MvSof-1268-A1-R1_Chr9g10691 [Microbotryum saponariae]
MTKGKRKGSYRTASTSVSASNSPSLGASLPLPSLAPDAAPGHASSTASNATNNIEAGETNSSERQPLNHAANPTEAVDGTPSQIEPGPDEPEPVPEPELEPAPAAPDSVEPVVAASLPSSALCAPDDAVAATNTSVLSPEAERHESPEQTEPTVEDSVEQSDRQYSESAADEPSAGAEPVEGDPEEVPLLASTSVHVEEEVDNKPLTTTIEPEAELAVEPESGLATNYAGKPRRSAATLKKSPPPPASKNKMATGKKGATKRTPKLDDSRELLKDEIYVEKRGARAARAGAKKLVEVDEDEGFLLEEEEEADGAEGFTRCICGEDTVEKEQELMIQCDTCKCWQHGPCIGLVEEEVSSLSQCPECPDRYFCELCKPTWHGQNGQIRKTHRKVMINRTAALPLPPGQTSVVAPTTMPVTASIRGQKPRESADAALVSAYLAAESTGDASAAAIRHESRSLSPNQQGGGTKAEPAPKKRSTMNSRDAAYDDAIALSLMTPAAAAMRAKLEKRTVSGDDAAGLGLDEDGVLRHPAILLGELPSLPSLNFESAPPPPGAPEAKMDVDVDGLNQSGANFDDDSSECSGSEPPAENERGLTFVIFLFFPAVSPNPNASARAKHPNQYTYRPKPGPTPSGRGRGSPVKRASGRDTSGGASLANTSVNASGVTMASSEHPSRTHRPQRDWVPGNDPSGWGIPEHLKHLSHLLPTPSPQPIHVPRKRSSDSYSSRTPPTTAEAPTKIRFPNKRMTMPEMRKRARNVLEYLTRVQIEMSDREKRTERVEKAALSGGSGASGSTAAVQQNAASSDHLDSMSLMDELTKDIIMFQKTYFEG